MSPEIKLRVKYLKYKYLKHRIRKNPRYLLTKRVLSFLQNTNNDTPLSETEREQFIKFLRRHLIEVFNYPFVAKYHYRRVKVYLDKEIGLRYVLTDENRRLYFQRGMKARHVRGLYNSLCCEQDELSPHNYCFYPLQINSNAVFADLGAAEGIFTLKFIDKIKTAYLFECENKWIEALQVTFRPWKDKIIIVNKYVANRDDDKFTSLDYFFREREKPTLIKIDVEGAENDIFKGADQLLNEGINDILVCTYHRKGDEQNLSRQLQAKRYETVHSPGYMLFHYEAPNYALEEPFDFRRGLIHASFKDMRS